ncbi:DUF4142 domain-containing protein [Massilia consociata]|uniref:DUF4142 domain-containing protein n=1 Tax=Massilia consociata TaxID=760117 RepID=A0ABV6FJK3_9BURK
MQKPQRIQRALALSLAGLMFAASAVHAQTGGQSGQGAAQPAAQGAATATPAAKPAAKLDRADRNALTDMAMSNMAEIATAKLALSKSQHAGIRAFAQRMVDEHTPVLAEVQALAQAKGVELPTELSATHKAKSKMLEALNGDVFDRSYLRHSGRYDHRITHEKLKDNMEKLKDPDIKALAMKMRPIVEQHLLQADELIAKTARSATSTSGTPGNDTTTITGKEPIPMKK